MLLATSDAWLKTVDGRDDLEVLGGHHPEEAVFSFKDNRIAAFNTFKVLIGQTSASNLREFELLIANDSPTGPFKSIGRFLTQNTTLLADPYQQFKFAPTTSRYLKVRLISNHNGYDSAFEVREFQLLGKLVPASGRRGDPGVVRFMDGVRIYSGIIHTFGRTFTLSRT